MRTPIVLAAIAFGMTMAVPADALPIGTNSSSFSCDVNTGECKCDGVWTGADCEAMKKNCKNSGATHDCQVNPGLPRWCTCSMSMAKTPGKVAPIAPQGTLKLAP